MRNFVMECFGWGCIICLFGAIWFPLERAKLIISGLFFFFLAFFLLIGINV
jgi:hypothetical protein